MIVKKHIFFILLLSLSSLMFAQDAMPRMAIGLNGGFNQSIVDFGRSINTDYVSGISGGVQFQYMSRKMLGFETGLFFTQLGWKEKNANREIVGINKTQVLEFPLYSHLAIGKGRLRLLIDAGPYFRFLVGQKIEGTIQPGTNFENKEPENANSYGLSFRGGFGWRSNNLIIQLRGNYHLGLTNFYKPTIATDQSVERSLGGSLSILIPIGNIYIDD